MLYSTQPTQSEDGTYFVKATTNEKRKKFVQINKAIVVDESDSVSDVSLQLHVSGLDKVYDVDAENIQAAIDNSIGWFGQQMTEAQIKRAYQPSAPDGILGCDTIPATKIFNSEMEVTDNNSLTDGSKCKVIVEFSGLWFAKKTFGPIWNLVQVKLFAAPIIDDYPDAYAFEDTEDEEEEAPAQEDQDDDVLEEAEPTELA